MMIRRSREGFIHPPSEELAKCDKDKAQSDQKRDHGDDVSEHGYGDQQ